MDYETCLPLFKEIRKVSKMYAYQLDTVRRLKEYGENCIVRITLLSYDKEDYTTSCGSKIPQGEVIMSALISRHESIAMEHYGKLEGLMRDLKNALL